MKYGNSAQMVLLPFWEGVFSKRKEYSPKEKNMLPLEHHYGKTPIQIYWKFHLQKNEKFQIKNSDIFHISAQNIALARRF